MFSGKSSSVSHLEETNFRVSIAQNRSHEDFFSIAKLNDECYFYAVFDGHGGGSKEGNDLSGDHCVLYLKDYLHSHVFEELQGVDYHNKEQIKEKLKTVFWEVDEYLYENGANHGSTCSLVIVTPINVIFANLGDSQAVKIENKKVTFETDRHVATKERLRIKRAGGFVEGRRVNGIYAPSRSFGDYDCKLVKGKYSPEGPMSATPDVHVLPRTKGMIILGTDGLFDGFSDMRSLEELVNSAKRVSDIPDLLSDHAKPKNSNDDITCILIFV
jgi:serine/threonine protein phosphatase PrpC